ncbi:MAG: 2Fe-2S iron-sulfur cluster-binding protein [Spongiibacteraceae bacterium]
MNKTFRVSLPDGACFDAAENESLLTSAQRAQWLVRYGCRNGNCDACAAKLLAGSVRFLKNSGAFSAGDIVSAPAAKILLCLCEPLSELQIALPSDPRPGSLDQSLRCYARLDRQTVSANESVLYFALPAGRKPALLSDQIALIETDNGLLQGNIDHAQSRGRELVVKFVFASLLQSGGYYHVRYPISATSSQES